MPVARGERVPVAVHVPVRLDVLRRRGAHGAHVLCARRDPHLHADVHPLRRLHLLQPLLGLARQRLVWRARVGGPQPRERHPVRLHLPVLQHRSPGDGRGTDGRAHHGRHQRHHHRHQLSLPNRCSSVGRGAVRLHDAEPAALHAPARAVRHVHDVRGAQAVRVGRRRPHGAAARGQRVDDHVGGARGGHGVRVPLHLPRPHLHAVPGALGAARPAAGLVQHERRRDRGRQRLGRHPVRARVQPDGQPLVGRVLVHGAEPQRGLLRLHLQHPLPAQPALGLRHLQLLLRPHALRHLAQVGHHPGLHKGDAQRHALQHHRADDPVRGGRPADEPGGLACRRHRRGHPRVHHAPETGGHGHQRLRVGHGQQPAELQRAALPLPGRRLAHGPV
mmetsp:Transcript_38805/g.102608  ORF Transcript_38805/g.102608 Transcript_38805/m.102608 type:complete len:390 (+) Transcript_38805:1386-2555(+)